MENSSEMNTTVDTNQSFSGSMFQTRRFYYTCKRALDILLSLLALLVLSPLFLIIAILIKLDSPGPVFFRQKRVGAKLAGDGKDLHWDREDFWCYKFRSMTTNADESVHQEYIKAYIANNESAMKEMEGENTKLHKLVNDQRITNIGRYLRKFSLDELPQFWNVLRGDMSLVGPRPCIPYELEMYTDRHRQRLQAKPGVTGLQQTVARCTISFEDQVNLDIEYITKQSFWFDLKILVMTPITIFTQKGA